MPHTLDDIAANPGLDLIHRVRDAEVPTPGGAPCLVLLHGVGANEAGLITFAQRQDPRLVVILVRGPLIFGPTQFGWFQVNFTADGPAIHAAQAEQSRQSLIAFIQRLPAAYNVDPHRIWMAGFSQGGIMSASVGLTAPTVLAGFGILSGRILPEVMPLVQDKEALRCLHAFVVHGKQDQKLGIHFARSAQEVLQGLHVPLHYREVDAGHELNEAMQRDFCEWMSRQLRGDVPA
jgi:phospholipase/carboxylesterase